jgi:G3E family GTPase
MNDLLPQVIPITLVTGFLGAGKTTFLNACLADKSFRDTAVIVNEFGDIPIDHHLVRAGSHQMMITTTGCICCTAHSDVRVSLFELFEASRTGQIPPFSRVAIETTGLADPAPIVNALTPGAVTALGIRDHLVARRFRLASIVACVDAVTGDLALNSAFEAMKQVAFASLIALTKADLLMQEASHVDIDRLKARLASINPSAEVTECIDIGRFFTRCFEETYTPNHISDDVVGWLAIDRMIRSDGVKTPPSGSSLHADDIRATTLARDGSMTREALMFFLTVLAKTAGAQLLRVKGLVSLVDDPDRPMVVHAVQHLIHPLNQLPGWPTDDRRTRLVVIGRGHDQKALTSLFNSLVDDPNIPRAVRRWRGSGMAVAGIATVVVTFAILQLIGASLTPAPQYTARTIGVSQ